MNGARVVLVLLVALVAPSPARAQEAACADVGLSFARPALAEWSDWIGVGGGIARIGQPDHSAVFALRVGGGVDFSIARIGSEQRYGGPVEVRSGPWLGAETTFRTSTLEGGLMLDFGQTAHARWGTFALRVGGGVQLQDERWAPAGSVTLSWGVRSVLGRYSDGGGCVRANGRTEIVEPGVPRRSHAHASGIRIFGTGRLDGDGHAMLVFGVEIEPTFVLPPYSGGRFIGTRPN